MILRFVLGVFGLIELLFPRKVVQYIMDITAVGETTYEFKSWVYKLARLEGLIFIFVALWSGKNEAEST